MLKLGSLPMRGAWIEIYIEMKCARPMPGRSPCGERGLKFVDPTVPVSRTPSLPMRGAWIEIVNFHRETTRSKVAPHAGSVD